MVDFVDAMAKMFNFKWTAKKYHSSEWTSSPSTGNWSNPNSTFTGIFGTFNNLYKASCGGTMVEHLPHHPEVKGPAVATGLGRK